MTGPWRALNKVAYAHPYSYWVIAPHGVLDDYIPNSLRVK